MSVVLDHVFFLCLRVRIDHLAYKRAYLSVPVKPWPVFWLLNILVKCQVTKYRKKSDRDTNWWHFVTTVKKGLTRKTFRSYPCQWFSQKFRLTHNIWLIIIRKSFRGDILYCLIELFFLSVILALILKKTEDNSLFGVKLLIHHWTSNLHDADYESTTMKARIQTWSAERGQKRST